uniref:TRASH domain-containing protein n=1 Tax=Mola mola TaxID=94237 RepID=A0A3Q3VLI9_MOLML
PLVKVKDEPADDEYEQALISSASTTSIKDEPNPTKVGFLESKDNYGFIQPKPYPPAPETQTLPIIHPSSLQMSCSHCKKNLMKGQTAFQRKGSPALFCSTSCLTTFLPAVKGPSKVCHNCQKLILRPQDVILAPDSKGAMKDFCSQNLHRGLISESLVFCSVLVQSKHEVILNSAVHKLCSDACFKRFRTVNNLSMAGCANCGTYCHSKPVLLKMDGSSQTLCNAECLAKYKEKTKITHPCMMCHTTRLLADMVDNKNSDDSVNLFCSSSCVMAFKVQTVSASGARLNCDSCGKNTVPAYHLAMSDTSIRNFCTLPCVMAFQVMRFADCQIRFCFSQRSLDKQASIFTKLPIGSTQIQGVTPKLSCAQCNCNITFKPELIQIKDKLVFVCSVDCSLEFKKANYVTCLCEYCKMEKVIRDSKRINKKDCFFCSDGCKLLYRHDLTKNWGKHCHSCVYCHSISKKLVTAQYGGSIEEFCSDECRSRYTMLFCHVAKCDTCGRKGKLKQTVKVDIVFLSMAQCPTSLKIQTLGKLYRLFLFFVCFLGPPVIGEATPVIANVISLAGKSNTLDKTARQILAFLLFTHHFSVFQVSVQTDTVRAPPPAPKVLKNKALLCRPLVQNKGVSCRTQTVDFDAVPQVLVVPVPVPVYVPVPMNMYTQCTPKPVGVPLPLPVPMFLPVTMDSAERIVETIQEIKEKIPSDPFEAELILMAEMVAEQDDKKEKEERPKEKERERQVASAPDGRKSAFVTGPPPGPPPMDLEADVTVGEEMGLFSLPPQPVKSVSRKSQRLSKAAEASSKRGSSVKKKPVVSDFPKLKSQYGVDAWKRWIQWRWTQPNLEKPRYASRVMELKEDVLQCTTAELSYGLCCFIRELKRPNGEAYSPDSLFYLCLGIQQYLFENGRVENIFMDRFYNRFSNEFTSMLKDFKPSITESGYIHSRVEEEFLWDCKQLGAYSPIVLLNTLLFFCCKYFGFTSVQQHRQLSFAHVMRCTKTNQNYSKTTFLRFYPPLSVNESDPEVPAKRRKDEEGKEEILEMMENTDNPLRCPVRLYEFYLSKCSESVKQRTNLFYLHPERSCVPNSPLWFSSTPLDDSTMEAMLIRILTVRELQVGRRKGGRMKRQRPDDSPFLPEDEDEDGDSE